MWPGFPRRSGPGTAYTLVPEPEQCWAHALGCSWEKHLPNESSHGHHPCTQRAVDEIGLCEEHHAEIVGRDRSVNIRA